MSKQNSYKAGIFALELFGPTTAGLAEWERFKGTVSRIYGHYRPKGVMEELLVDKVVIESVRFARLLKYENDELDRVRPFDRPSADRVLRYQSAINRQMTKTIEMLEELQAARNAASAPDKRVNGSTPDDVLEEPWNTPKVVFPGDRDDVAAESLAAFEDYCNATLQTADELLSEPSYVDGPDEMSPSGEESSNSVAQPAENRETTPPTPVSSRANDDEDDRLDWEQMKKKRPLRRLKDRKNSVMPSSSLGIKPQGAEPVEPDRDDIVDCL
jgi:hypothetical protein